VVEAMISHGPEEVMFDGSCDYYFMAVLPQFQENILNDIFGYWHIPYDSECIGIERLEELSEQSLESRLAVMADGFKSL